MRKEHDYKKIETNMKQYSAVVVAIATIVVEILK